MSPFTHTHTHNRGLDRVLVEKYLWGEEEADAMTDFLTPMLHYSPLSRMTAKDCLAHPWLQETTSPSSTS